MLELAMSYLTKANLTIREDERKEALLKTKAIIDRLLGVKK